MAKYEHCSVVYFWQGRGLTQEIQSIHIEGAEPPGWAGKKWTDFLNFMSTQGWELVAVASKVNTNFFTKTASTDGLVAYFRRLC